MSDVDNAASGLAVIGTSTNLSLVPLSGISVTGSGNERTVILTPSAGRTGSSTISLVVSDGGFATSTSFVATVIPGGFVSWKQTHFGAAAGLPLIAGDNADPDADGVVNLLEYAAGTCPIAVDIFPESMVAMVGSHLAFATRRNTVAIDLILSVEASASLAGPWVTLARSANGGAFLPSMPGVLVTETGLGALRNATITDPNPASASRTRFIRLKAVR